MDWYRAHYPKTIGGRSIGEVAPTYFASAEARERIAKLFPQARVVCIFRNPVERVLSLYRVKRAYGMIPWSFEQSLLNDPELTDTSRYASNLKAWQRALGPERVLPTVYDDLWINPQSYLDSVVDFIGIPRFVLTSQQYRSVHSSDGLTHPRSYMRTRSATKIADWLKAQRLDPVVAFVRNSRLRRLFLGGGAPFADLAPDLVTRLYEHFRDEVEQLEDMLRRDFSAWKGRSMGSSTKSQYPA
jgi:hypothetical protein